MRCVPLMLMGAQNSGKTLLGRSLAQLRGWSFLDTDQLIEELYTDSYGEKLSCRSIAQQRGEGFFRQLEGQALSQCEEKKASIIALGGGTPIYHRIPPDFHKVYLYVPADEIWKRTVQKGLPSYLNTKDPHDHFIALYQQRHQVYLEHTHQLIDLSGLCPQASLKKLHTQLNFDYGF